MRLSQQFASLSLLVALSVVACSPTDTGGDDGVGGAAGSGGASSGGSTTAGATSGGSASGGVTSGSGGAHGGTTATAGGSSAGGAAAGGSLSSNGGSSPSGGSAQGGASAGASGHGGTATAGATAAGGATAMGGMTGGGGMTTNGASHLPVPPGASNVPKPSGTPGNITVLNWAGFKAAVTYSFDDSNSSQISHYPTDLKPLGVPFTFYMWTGKSEASNAIWATALKDGHEIANHTQSHQSAGTAADVDAATQFIMQKYGVQAWTMAAPNGAAVYTDLAKPRFMINRGVSDKVIMPNDNSDPFTLPTYIPDPKNLAFNSEVDAARTAGGWRTMCVHGFTGGSDGAYMPVPIEQFVAGVQHAKELGDVWIDTMTNVGAYWLGQKAFSSATTSTAGSDKTWTWKLPAHFPPGHYLRVKVDGGTLKQGGSALTWDSHGYYEIALDALSVTLSP